MFLSKHSKKLPILKKNYFPDDLLNQEKIFSLKPKKPKKNSLCFKYRPYLFFILHSYENVI